MRRKRNCRVAGKGGQLRKAKRFLQVVTGAVQSLPTFVTSFLQDCQNLPAPQSFCHSQPVSSVRDPAASFSVALFAACLHLL